MPFVHYTPYTCVKLTESVANAWNLAVNDISYKSQRRAAHKKRAYSTLPHLWYPLQRSLDVFLWTQTLWSYNSLFKTCENGQKMKFVTLCPRRYFAAWMERFLQRFSWQFCITCAASWHGLDSRNFATRKKSSGGCQGGREGVNRWQRNTENRRSSLQKAYLDPQGPLLNYLDARPFDLGSGGMFHNE